MWNPVCGIVVLYESRDNDLDNILSYLDMLDYLLILDNSKTNHQKVLERKKILKKSKVEYIHYKKNIGLCAALNNGVKIAENLGYKWVLIMDDDSKTVNCILDIYFKYLNESVERDRIAVLSPVHLFDRSSAREYHGTKDIRWAMTSGCLYNVKIFLEQGGFNKDLFVECLDLDYCFRIYEKGYRIVECGEALLDHKPGMTKEFSLFGHNLFKYGFANPWRYYMQTKSLTWLTLRYRHLETIVLYFWKLLKVILLFPNKKEYLFEIKKGTKEGILLYKSYVKSQKNKN